MKHAEYIPSNKIELILYFNLILFVLPCDKHLNIIRQNWQGDQLETVKNQLAYQGKITSAVMHDVIVFYEFILCNVSSGMHTS